MNTIAHSALNPQVQQPSFDRSKLKNRIVHIGFGAFHRAHQALFTSETLAITGSDWGICEISLFSGEEMIKQLRAQDHLFSVLEKATDGPITKVCGAVVSSMHPKLDSIDAVINKLAEPEVAIVSLTITEKGYCADLSSGRLDRNNSLIQSDLANPEQPASAIGYIVEALRQRREAGRPAFAVMSCDNIPGNSKVARQVILDYAHERDSELAQWIKDHASFPCTMVDRIVPAMTDASRKDLTEQLGTEDPCGIVCEAFRQWVIEDDFVNGRPDWDSAGAAFVEDVTPFEDMKLRMLNGSHSFLAYLGYLGGHQYVYQTMADPIYRSAAYALMTTEQAPTLSMPKGTDLTQYADLLIARFSNTAIKHETWQIATDGSQKLPQRMCESLRYHLAVGTQVHWLILGLAGWMIYVGERDENGEAISVRDPMLEQFRIALKGAETAQQTVLALLGLEQIFGNDLIRNKPFVDRLVAAVHQLQVTGARATIEKTLQSLNS